MKSPKLVTVTLRKPAILVDITSDVKRLRWYLKRKGYDIRAWFGVVEPPNHMHLIWDCDYIPQGKLARIWGMVTGDSYIVDIRKVYHHDILGYLAKYLGKPLHFESAYDIKRLKGVHMIASWNVLNLPYIGSRCPKCGEYGTGYPIPKSLLDYPIYLLFSPT